MFKTDPFIISALFSTPSCYSLDLSHFILPCIQTSSWGTESFLIPPAPPSSTYPISSPDPSLVSDSVPTVPGLTLVSAVASLLCLLSLTGLPSCENQHDLSKSCLIPCCPPINLECRPSSSLPSSFSGLPLYLQHGSCTFCCQKESFLPPHLIHGSLLHMTMLTALLG